MTANLTRALVLLALACGCAAPKNGVPVSGHRATSGGPSTARQFPVVITPEYSGAIVPASQALPGWSVYIGNVTSSTVFYNTTTDGAAQNIGIHICHQPARAPARAF
jgi:hypothetical protein